MALGAGVLLASPSSASAYPVYVCERPDGSLSETTFPHPARREEAIAQMRRDGTVPNAPGACWEMDSSSFPAASRPDPRVPGQGLNQRHRWRRGAANTVIVDPSIRRPQVEATLLALTVLLPPARLAEVLSTPAGDNLFRAIRSGDNTLARALFHRMRALTGPAAVLAVSELAELERIGDAYEWSWR